MSNKTINAGDTTNNKKISKKDVQNNSTAASL
jgi:hypothetical protein